MIIQNILYEFLLAIGERTENGEVYTLSTSGTAVGTVNGIRFPIQRQIDILNFAHQALFRAYVITYRKPEWSGVLPNTSATLTFATASGVATADKPADFVEVVSFDGNVYLRPNSRRVAVQNQVAHWIQSATQRFIFEDVTRFVAYDIPVGQFADASTVTLNYITIPTYVISDVTGGTTETCYKNTDVPLLIDLAKLIADGQGLKEVASLGAKMIGGK